MAASAKERDAGSACRACGRATVRERIRSFLARRLLDDGGPFGRRFSGEGRGVAPALGWLPSYDGDAPGSGRARNAR